jgi:hypothetical protein
VDFNSKDSEGASLLHSAASNGFAKVVTFLIAEEVNLNVADDHGDTPLHLAVFFNYPDVVSLLGAAGCEMEPLNRMQEAPMFYAEQLGEEKEGDATMIRLLKALIAKKKADSGDATRKKINASSNSVKRKSIAEKTNTKKKDGKNMAAEMAAFNGEEIVMFDDGSGSDADAKDKKKGKKGEKNSKKITHQASAKKEKARGSIVPGGAIDADIDAHNDGLQHAEGTHVDHHHHKAARMSMVDGELAGLDAKKKGGGCCIVM